MPSRGRGVCYESGHGAGRIRGTLVGTPSLANSLSSSQLTSELDSNTYGQQLLTVGPMSGTSSPIEDSAALMVPTGSAAQCTGYGDRDVGPPTGARKWPAAW